MPTLELTEFERREVPASFISEAAGQRLWTHYAPQVQVEPPSFKTEGQWRLQAQGWVGHIPLTHDLRLILQPKVPFENLFQMLAYAYRLPVRWLAGATEVRSLAQLYEQLATLLAERVLERARRGLYRAYVSRRAHSPVLRGRLDMAQLARSTTAVSLPCHFEEQTADQPDNQLLLWTLHQLSRSGLYEPPVAPLIKRAYQALQGQVSLIPHPAEACLKRSYHRLNEDYRPLHGLCYFFLSQSGPAHQVGQRWMVPFLVEMARLYEQFVAAWLQEHLPTRWLLREQERLVMGQGGSVEIAIDLVMIERESGRPLLVLDTKYKTAPKASQSDIYQIAFYAQAKSCPQAILLYPQPLAQPLDLQLAGSRVRSLSFDLHGDLEANGQRLLATLTAAIEHFEQASYDTD